MNKYGFWITPDGEVFAELQKTINELASRYTAPTFSPHMTLHGVVESTDSQVVEKVQNAIKNTQPFKLELGVVEFSTTYFQCVFVRIKTNANLVNAHLELRNAFDSPANHVFMPHASLLYSDMNMEEREKVSNSITITESSFVANEVTIVRADESNPKTWEVVAKVLY